MLIRAFLSYSHHDSAIVDAVAEAIGRPFVTIDRISFRSGDELVEAMDRSAAEAAVFVAFVSRESLSSVWVQHELSEARFYSSSGRLKNPLAVMLDSRVEVSELPAWMRRYKVIRSTAAKPIARLIRSLIDEVVHERQSPYFVNRSREVREAQAALVPLEADRGSNFVILRGLPGVGRRSVLRRAARDSLQIDRLLVVRVAPGDAVTELASKLADLVEPANTAPEAIELARHIGQLGLDQLVERFIVNCRAALQHRELVTLYDEGGLLDNYGYFHDDVSQLLSVVGRELDLPLGIITSRRPKWVITESQQPDVIAVNPLGVDDMRQLVALVARNMEVNVDGKATEKLAAASNGYPPSVPVLVSRVKDYGIGTIEGSSVTRAIYNPRQLSRYLEKLELSTIAQQLASALAANSPVPIEVLSDYAGGSPPVIDGLVELIDASIACHDDATSWYRISEPARDFIVDNYGRLTTEQYSRFAVSLDSYLSSSDEPEAYLSLSGVLFRALKQAGSLATRNAYALVSDWIALAESSYHQRDYAKAAEFAQEALNARPKSIDALQWLIKAQVKCGKFVEALEALEDLRAVGEEREANFLRGFAERHRGNYQRAITYYERAKNQGRGGTSILRDMADCYFQLRELETASTYIAEAQERDPHNRFLTSLRIKIAIERGDETTASTAAVDRVHWFSRRR
jgi:tetratricopeptide (TPR) repeat protein